MNNQMIVFYNIYLATKFNAYINVKICSMIQVVYYLFKYIYKGHDQVTINFKNNKINGFFDVQYVSLFEVV